jgi:sugar/nucleoside kinase (ribokinase family)
MRATRRRWITAPASVDFLDLNDARLVTVGSFLAALGADADTIRRYAGQVGIRMAKALRAAGGRPGKVLVLIKHRCRASFRKAQNAYAPELLPLLAQVVADYARTAQLADPTRYTLTD